MAARRWSEAQKAEQSAKIHGWKPWNNSSGPKSVEGKAVVSRNAYSGYFRKRVRLVLWLLRTKNSTTVLTPELIAETKWRADKLNIEFSERIQHEQFFNDMAKASVESAMTYPHKKMINYYMTSVLVSAARQTVLGNHC